ERGVDHLGGTADMEGTHGELGAGFTDGLSSDNADSFTDIDRGTTCQVATIASRTAALTQVANQRRANADRLDASLFDDVDVLFLEQDALGSNQLTRDRVIDIVRSGTAQNALAQRSHDLTCVNDRLHGQATLGAAILGHDDGVLRNVDQTTGQVTRVRGLQSGISQPLTGTVGRVEVLENVQAFLEVRSDRRLDDRAVRLGHQAAHAGELLHLCR